MKKIFRIETSLRADRLFSEEMNHIVAQAVFSKISILENYYLKGVTTYFYSDEITEYLRFLRENIVIFKSKYENWTDTWVNEIKPYILDNFRDENLLHVKKYNGRNLYDRLHDIAKYSDLHDN